MSRVDSLRGNYQELPGEGAYDHIFELYNEFEELNDRIFWNDRDLKYVRHYPAERSADVLEILDGEDACCSYYTIGGPTLFGGSDISTELKDVSLHGFPVDQVLEDLKTASATGVVDIDDTTDFFQSLVDPSDEDLFQGVDYRVIFSTSVNALRGIVDQHRESIPPDVYMEV